MALLSHIGITKVYNLHRSHCDPGWLLTYKQYYDTQVSKIITNVISQLLVDSNKKFIWSEM